MINYISKPFRWFFKLEAASGLVLFFAAIIALLISCLLYTSDAADDSLRVDLGGRRIIKSIFNCSSNN